MALKIILSDGVIHLVMERSADDVSRKMSVIKMRHTNHMLGYKPFKWKPEEQRFTTLCDYSTVTDFAKFLGLSTSQPSAKAA